MSREQINKMVEKMVAMGLDVETIAFFVRAATCEITGGGVAHGERP